MITLFNNIQIDSVVASISSFIVLLALVAIYQMHDLKKGVLFLLYILGSAFMVFLFMNYSSISAILVLLYIGHLVYNNLGNKEHIK